MKEKAEPTPGPWRWWDNKSGRPKVYDLAKLISGNSDQSHSGDTILTLYGGDGEKALGTSKRKIANARLIASAPDLLAERQQISTELGLMEWGTPEHAQELLHAFIEKFHYSDAVAKATGVARLDKAVEAAVKRDFTYELLAMCKELRDASAACFRVIAKCGGVVDLEQELDRSGIHEGFGRRVDILISEAEGRTVESAVREDVNAELLAALKAVVSHGEGMPGWTDAQDKAAAAIAKAEGRA